MAKPAPNVELLQNSERRLREAAKTELTATVPILRVDRETVVDGEIVVDREIVFDAEPPFNTTILDRDQNDIVVGDYDNLASDVYFAWTGQRLGSGWVGPGSKRYGWQGHGWRLLFTHLVKEGFGRPGRGGLVTENITATEFKQRLANGGDIRGFEPKEDPLPKNPESAKDKKLELQLQSLRYYVDRVDTKKLRRKFPQLSDDEVERLCQNVVQFSLKQLRSQAEEFDLKKTPDPHYVPQEFPRMLYHHERRTTTVVSNQAQLDSCLVSGWSKEPFPLGVADDVLVFEQSEVDDPKNDAQLPDSPEEAVKLLCRKELMTPAEFRRLLPDAAAALEAVLASSPPMYERLWQVYEIPKLFRATAVFCGRLWREAEPEPTPEPVEKVKGPPRRPSPTQLKELNWEKTQLPKVERAVSEYKARRDVALELDRVKCELPPHFPWSRYRTWTEAERAAPGALKSFVSKVRRGRYARLRLP
jgi:hypothetical protein